MSLLKAKVMARQHESAIKGRRDGTQARGDVVGCSVATAVVGTLVPASVKVAGTVDGRVVSVGVGVGEDVKTRVCTGAVVCFSGFRV